MMLAAFVAFAGCALASAGGEGLVNTWNAENAGAGSAAGQAAAAPRLVTSVGTPQQAPTGAEPPVVVVAGSSTTTVGPASAPTDVCIEYMLTRGCSWTLSYNCPGQRMGSSGSFAKNDNSIGYKCCCAREGWKGVATTPGPTPAPVVYGVNTIAPVGAGYTMEGIPNYIYKHKYRLMRWFEDNSMCPLDTGKGFPAWVGWKATMAAGGAITTPKQGMAGYRTLQVAGFCPWIESQKFSCVTEGAEIKARSLGDSGITIRIDEFFCKLQDISLYKLTDGFTGVRFDFSQCSGQINLGFSNKHVPKTASLNMQLTEEDPQVATDPKKKSPEFTNFFKAVCSGGTPAKLFSSMIPNFAPTMVPRKPGLPARKMPVCFAQSANALHVMGKSCYEDFAFFDFHAPDGHLAKIPAKDLDSLRRLIPHPQAQLHPSLAPMMATAIAGQAPRKLEDESESARDVEEDGSARKLAGGSPCGTVAPGKPADTGSPCGTPAPVTCGCTTPGKLCNPYSCPKNFRLRPMAGAIPCKTKGGCTKDDLNTCCVKLITTTTTTPISEVPGVVIADRICVQLFGCACNNDCDCINAAPLSATTTTTKPNAVVFCLDNWWEILAIGIMTLLFVPYATTQFVLPCINDMWDENFKQVPGESDSVPKKIQMGSTLHQSMREVSAQGYDVNRSNVYKGVAPARDSDADVGRVTTVVEMKSRNVYLAAFVDWIAVGIVSLGGVILSWAIWKYFVMEVVLKETCNVDIPFFGACPYSLCSLWVGEWFVVWFAHVWLYITRKTRREETKAGFTQSMGYSSYDYGHASVISKAGYDGKTHYPSVPQNAGVPGPLHKCTIQ